MHFAILLSVFVASQYYNVSVYYVCIYNKWFDMK